MIVKKYLEIFLSEMSYNDAKQIFKLRIWSLSLRELFLIFVFASMSCKMCNRFLTIFLWPRWSIDLKLLQVCQFMYKVDYIKCLHFQQLFCLRNQFCNVPLIFLLTAFSHRETILYICVVICIIWNCFSDNSEGMASFVKSL